MRKEFWFEPAPQAGFCRGIGRSGRLGGGEWAGSAGRRVRYCFVAGLGLLGLWGYPVGAWAQPGSPAAADTVRVGALSVSVVAQGAFIVNHSAAIAHLAASHPSGWELSVERQTTGRAPWHGWYRFPRVGLALVSYDFHNPVLGQSLAATLYLSKALHRGARQEMNLRLGTGVAWFTKPYDLATNRQNTLVSSALNATVQVRLDYERRLTPGLGLVLGLGLTHYSNGGASKPNYGVNLPTAQLGLRLRQPRALPPASGRAPAPNDVGHNFLYVSAGVGSKRRTPGDPTRYLVTSLSVAGGRRLNAKSNLLLGLEAYDDRSLPTTLADDPAYAVPVAAAAPLPDTRKASAFVGHELLLGRLAVNTQLGAYFYSPYRSSTTYYQRLGLKYQLTDHCFAALDLKAHRAVADVLELRLGVRLGRQRPITGWR